MKSKIFPILFGSISCILSIVSSVYAEDVISYFGSSQIYRAFVADTADDFTKETGIRVDAKEGRTKDAVPALAAGNCTIGGIARKMTPEEKAMGNDLSEILICMDHIAVFVDKANPVQSLTMQQLQDIFSGKVTSWKDVGGSPEAIRVVVPSNKTACHENFKSAVMAGVGFSQSATVTETAGAVLDKMDANSISFLSYGAIIDDKRFKVISVGKVSPGYKTYPIAQEMYLVVKKDAPESVKKYIIYFTKGNGRQFLKKVKLVSPYSM